MAKQPQKIIVIGAGINGLVAANYLARAGQQVTLIESKSWIGGACTYGTVDVDGVTQDYPLGATTLGLMQRFVWEETGLSQRLQAEAAGAPGLAHFPGMQKPAVIYADVARQSQELAEKWGEEGDLAAFYADLDKVVKFLQTGYRAGRPPTLAEAEEVLGADQTNLWISGSAKGLLDHYLTADRTKLKIAQNVSESGPVALSEPYSAFSIPIMNSGSIFDGGYGYVRGGIWQISDELGRINRELGVEILTSCPVQGVDPNRGTVRFETATGSQTKQADHVLFATDPQTAARLISDESLIEQTTQERVLGTSGKLNLMFRKPVRWKESSDHSRTDIAFRYIFAVDTVVDFDSATQTVLQGEAFAPGFYQVYCEGAGLRHMGAAERFDRLTVFFKNLALDKTGDQLEEVEAEVKRVLFNHITNPEDCVWSRLLSPRDLQQTFGFPGGNIEHTMLVDGQTFFDRQYAADPNQRFYQFGRFGNLSICGSSTYPCGSVTGTPGYMCAVELLRHME